MKIRTQNMMAMVPLFAGLAVLIGALMYYVQYRELVWGLEEESTSLAVAMAEYIEPDRLEDLLDGNTDARTRFAEEAGKVLGWGRARTLAVLGADGEVAQVVQSDKQEGMEAEPVWAVSAGIESRLKEGVYTATPMLTGPYGEHTMQGFAPLFSENGEWVATLAVEISADHVAAHLAGVLREGQWVVVLSVGLGLALAIGLSGIITKRIHALNHAAEKLEQGHALTQPPAGRVQEINDLGNTFNTMGSVLNEVVAKTRRSVVEAEQFRTDEDLAHAFAETFMPDIAVQTDVWRGEAGLLSAQPGAHGFGVWPCADGATHLAVVFELDQDGGLAAAVNASAAASLLRDRLAREDNPVRVLENWCVAHRVTRLSAVLPDTENPRDEQRFTWDASARKLRKESQPQSAAAYVLLHTLTPESAQRVEAYLSAFSRSSIAGLLNELRAVLDQNKPGALIVLMRTDDATSAIVSS
jgi:HAMP domain-containing protein